MSLEVVRDNSPTLFKVEHCSYFDGY